MYALFGMAPFWPQPIWTQGLFGGRLGPVSPPGQNPQVNTLGKVLAQTRQPQVTTTKESVAHVSTYLLPAADWRTQSHKHLNLGAHL